MRLSKSIQIMSMVTILALIYIHMQMQIFDLAYQGKKKENVLVSISENNDMVAYDILQLKSSNHLGGKLLAEDSEMRFRDNENVIQLVTAERIIEDDIIPSIKPKKSNPLLSFLSLRSPAEARAEERHPSVKPWQRSQ